MLGKALDYGLRRQLVIRNVARVVELPVTARRTEPGRSLTVDQANVLLEATADDRLHALWRVMLMLGLRPGEATGLTWSDIDHKNHIIHVRRALKLERGQLVVTDTLKTTRSRRSLKADPAVIDTLRRHKKQQASQQLAVGFALLPWTALDLTWLWLWLLWIAVVLTLVSGTHYLLAAQRGKRTLQRERLRAPSVAP